MVVQTILKGDWFSVFLYHLQFLHPARYAIDPRCLTIVYCAGQLLITKAPRMLMEED